MRYAETVTFGGSGLERAAHLRGNPPVGDVMPVWRGKPLLDTSEELRRVAFIAADHAVFAHAIEPAIFLGMDGNHALYARDVSAWEPPVVDDSLGAFFDNSEQHHPDLPDEVAFGDLRANMVNLSARSAELASTARALLEWHRTHQFCSRCGTRSTMSMAGWQRDCSNCGAKHFPRTDPVVIMLILRGNSVLMGRSPQWPDGMYSLLAGFVEPGETIEAAVRREVKEEAGVDVGAVDYLASQPWPFPASLMFGCRGMATSHEINIDPVEIEDAVWVTREEMVDALVGTHPTMKPARKGAIARFLIEHWLADTLD